MMTRTADIIALGESAASTDPELAEYRDRAHAATRADLRALAAELNRRGALGPGISEQDAVDTLYALATNESVFLRLTRQCGWTPRTIRRPHRPHPDRNARHERGTVTGPTLQSGRRRCDAN